MRNEIEAALIRYSRQYGPEVVTYACNNLLKSDATLEDLERVFEADFLGVFPTPTAAALNFQKVHAMPSFGSRSLSAAEHWVRRADGAVGIWRYHNGTDPNPFKGVAPLPYRDPRA